MKKWIRQWIPVLGIAFVLNLGIRAYVAEAMSVPTESMLPTIQVHDRVIVEKMLWLTKLKHGDIVVFRPTVSGEEGKRFVKRLIGLPGDTVEIKNGQLYRNDQPVEESYIPEPMTYNFGPVTVPERHYFFLGDNRNVSYDAHLWPDPFIPEERLVGKVLFELPTHLLY
ncbi:signal peptidase I [Paenibacillus sp. CN-4]|uniref:signal peptidase I n=1 Tax=Paenibacillus nanchangensis TaxID=3348343 RepID=UPI00397894D3